MKELVRASVRKLGYDLHRIPPSPGGTPISVVRPATQVPWHEIAETILAFFDRIPFLYANDVPAPLRIGGAWRGSLIERRPNQIDCIKRRDATALAELLPEMFFNELCLGLQDYGYYEGQTFADPSFLTAIERFEFVSGRKAVEIATDARLPTWGIRTGDRVLKYTDLRHAMQAIEVIRLLRSAAPIVVDLGSGFGGMAEKLARLHPEPIDIWLVDIPPNLTTAYAYLAAMFGRERVTLFSDRRDVAQIAPNDGATRFLLAPTLFVEHLPQEIEVVHNAGSLSEMDYETVAFYMRTLIDRSRFFIETNSHRSVDNWGHREVRADQFPINSHRLIARFSPFDATSPGFRYLTSIYIRS